jgi:hypothetical protein
MNGVFTFGLDSSQDCLFRGDRRDFAIEKRKYKSIIR